jgi:hypothetical protein
MVRRALILAGLLLAIASTRASSQQIPDPSFDRLGLTLAQSTVLSGADVGFRITHWDGDVPVGQVVMRINGAWLAPEIGK